MLNLAGADVRDLAQEYGTPLFVLDEEDFRSRCREFQQAFGAGSRVFYAAKAFCSRGVLRWVAQEGLGVDVCTDGELDVALQAGVDPAMITLHGSNKFTSELERAIGAGVGHIVVDSFEEIARLAHLTGEMAAPAPARSAPADASQRPPILVRVTSGVEAHTHEFVATAHDDQKFGFSLSSGAADEAVRRVLAAPGLDLAGLHSHIGSQIYDTAGFEVAAHRVLELAARIAAEHGVQMAELHRAAGICSDRPRSNARRRDRSPIRSASARDWRAPAPPPSARPHGRRDNRCRRRAARQCRSRGRARRNWRSRRRPCPETTRSPIDC